MKSHLATQNQVTGAESASMIHPPSIKVNELKKELKARGASLFGDKNILIHSVRSLLCTATNETPHERFFGFPRRSSAGASIPTWLATPGPVYIKRQVRTSKMDPLVDEVELLQANPHYAHVRYPDGRETTVATEHLAPKGHMEVSAPERVAEEVENLDLDVNTPDAEPSPAPNSQPELTTHRP